MSRLTACLMVKVFAEMGRCTVRELASAANTHESNVREWLYEMQRWKIVRPCGTVHRATPHRRDRRYLVTEWEWLL